MKPMWAAAIEMPTTEELKNSFERIPRKLNALYNRNRAGCAARYSGSPPGRPSVAISTMASPPSINLANCALTKLEYAWSVALTERMELQSFALFKKD